MYRSVVHTWESGDTGIGLLGLLLGFASNSVPGSSEPRPTDGGIHFGWGECPHESLGVRLKTSNSVPGYGLWSLRAIQLVRPFGVERVPMTQPWGLIATASAAGSFAAEPQTKAGSCSGWIAWVAGENR